MGSYLTRRFGNALLVLLVVSVATFALIQLAPGGPAILMNPDLDAETVARLRHNLGLDQPVPVQFYRWFIAALQGDFGHSLAFTRPVSAIILDRLPATLLLAACALVLAVGLGIPTGILAARRPHSLLDNALTFLSLLGFATPSFWMGIIFILIFAVQLGWLPSSGMFTSGEEFSLVDRAKHLILPSIVLSASSFAEIARYTRSSLLETLHQPYVTTAQGKGLTERQVLFVHALRNALIPVVTVIGVRIPRLASGAAITEAVFGWPGMGRLAVEAAFNRDYPIVMAVTLVVSAIVVLTNLAVDVLYVYIDPRIRLN